MAWFCVVADRLESVFAVGFHDVDEFAEHVVHEERLGRWCDPSRGERWGLEECEELGWGFALHGLHLLIEREG